MAPMTHPAEGHHFLHATQPCTPLPREGSYGLTPLSQLFSKLLGVWRMGEDMFCRHGKGSVLVWSLNPSYLCHHTTRLMPWGYIMGQGP